MSNTCKPECEARRHFEIQEVTPLNSINIDNISSVRILHVLSTASSLERILRARVSNLESMVFFFILVRYICVSRNPQPKLVMFLLDTGIF